MALGRQESAAVRRYLQDISAQRTVDKGALRKRITLIDQVIPTGDDDLDNRLRRQKNVLQAELREAEALDLETLEADFVKAVRGYSERKGVSYRSWRNFGVPPHVLAAGGIRAERAEGGGEDELRSMLEGEKADA